VVVTDEAFTRYEWERIMRRVRFGAPMTKYVGMVLAQYANTDGTNAFPSVDKLARVCEVSEKTVRTALGELRSRGLIVRTRKGGLRGTQAYSDVHDLAIPADLLDANDLLPPDESPIPNRQDVPVGDRPKRNVRTPQPVTDASQPVTEGVPTGTRYRLPNPDQSLDQTHNQRADHLRNATTEGADDGFDDFDSLSKVIRLSERRRGA
jgi:DNA-binding transcriptional MocR family regulator